jgi:hypothetical protein
MFRSIYSANFTDRYYLDTDSRSTFSPPFFRAHFPAGSRLASPPATGRTPPASPAASPGTLGSTLPDHATGHETSTGDRQDTHDIKTANRN